MNIAERLVSFHVTVKEDEYKGLQIYTDWDELFDEADWRAVNIEQDDDAESTLYEFTDGSVLVIAGKETSTYGSKN